MHTLTRTGNQPLSFSGDLIASESTRIVNGKDHTRWHELNLYRTGERYVIHVAYKTLWQGELDHETAEALDSPQAIVDYLRFDVDPCGQLGGFPDGDQFRDKQTRLVHDLQRRYATAVSKLMADYPEMLER